MANQTVTVQTKKYYSPPYNKECYAGRYNGYIPQGARPYGDELIQTNVDYWGYYNATDPFIVPFTEAEQITDRAPSAEIYIEGDITGFDAENWHTKSHIIATNDKDNPTAALALVVVKTVYNYFELCLARLYPGLTRWNVSHLYYRPKASGTNFNDAISLYASMAELRLILLFTDDDTFSASSPSTITSGKIFQFTDGTFTMSDIPSGIGGFFYRCTTVNEAPPEDPFPAADNDPYTPGGASLEGGGTGSFDPSSDPIDFPNLPTLSAADTGFITLFNPTLAQLKSLADYMWNSNLFDLDTWQKIFADPMDAIIGLSIVPVLVPSAGNQVVTVGNIATNVSMTVASSQYVEVDCGTLNVGEFWGSYLDYAPFTKCEIYLPFIGMRQLDTDDIMGKTLHVKYHVDILSGSCAAYVKCGDSVLYSYIGQCSSLIPFTAINMAEVVRGAINIAGTGVSLAQSGGMGAGGAISSIGNSILDMKPTIERSGTIGSTGGLLSIQKPYLILTRPNQCLPSRQNQFIGYPSFITMTLGEATGYTEVTQVHLDGITQATEQELTEIERLLKGGVIL